MFHPARKTIDKKSVVLQFPDIIGTKDLLILG